MLIGASAHNRALVVALSVAVLALVSVAAIMSARATGMDGRSLAAVPSPPTREIRGPAHVFGVDVVAEFAHDAHAFTQGLAFADDGFLYESTGLYGRSSLRRIDVRTGTVVQSHDLKNDEFGEGVTLASRGGRHLIQVLWKVGRGYVYDRATMQKLDQFEFDSEAWGIAQASADADEIFLSDGSSTIQVFRMVDGKFSAVRRVKVFDGDQEVGLLNELEMIGDELWANVYMSDFIARIDPRTGVVNSWLDLRGILKKEAIPRGHRIDVLNGIAHDSTSGAVYVTGKLWPTLFSIRVSDTRVSTNVSSIVDAFFLDPARVEYIHRYIIA